MRLRNLGGVLAALRQYFQEHAELAASISAHLLELPAIASGLLADEYEALGVLGAQDLEYRLFVDVNNPALRFSSGCR